MHTFDASGEYVVFYDAFGLSCLQLAAGKIKTDKAISGRWFTANGGTALAHNERANARNARSLPAVARAKLADGYDLKYQPVAVLADGKQAALGKEEGLELISLATGKVTASPKLAAGQKLKPFTLGPRLDPYKQWDTRTFVGTDDSFVVFTSSGTLFGGQLKKGAIVAPWSVKCGLPQGRVTAIPRASGTFVTAWHPALNRSFCAIIRDGKADVREVETLSPATWTGKDMVYQPSPGEVMRGTERFTLPQDAHGPGELMAHGATLLFIPFDRARVINLVTGKVIDRKLGSNLTALRTGFLEFERRFQELGRPANLLIDLDCMNKPRYGREHSPGFEWNDGDLGFLRLAVSAWLVHSLRTENGGRWSLGSYSNPQHIRPIDGAEMLRDFEAIDRGGIELLRVLDFLQHPFQEAWGGSGSEKAKPKKAMGDDAEDLLLWAVIEQVASKKRVELAKGAATWAKQKLTPELLVKKLDPSSERDDWNDAQFALAWVVLDRFGAGALPVFIDWLALRPSRMAIANSHIISDAPKRMMIQFPETKKPLLAAIAKAAKSAKGDQVHYFESLPQSLER
jgi:hypothetical protein